MLSLKPRIRVLRIIARMNVGGPAVQINGIMSDLPKNKFEQVLMTGYCDGQEKDYLEICEPTYDVIRVPDFGRKIGALSDFKAFMRIRKIIKLFSPDIVHTHTAKAGFIGRLAVISLKNKPQTVHTFHGHLLHGYFGKFKTRLLILIERMLAVRTSIIVAVGKQVRDDLLAVRIGNASQVQTIGPGLTLEKIPTRDEALKGFSLSDHPFTICWVGRMTTIKAPHRVIELARLTKEKKLNLRFVMAGEGALFQEMKEIVSQESLPVYFLGWQNKIEPVLAIADLVLLTSLNEGTPLFLIEAGMAGIPILSTNVGSVREVVINGQSGFCTNYSAKEFVRLIEVLEKDKGLRHSLGEYAKTHARSKYSRNRLVKDHEALYFSLLNQANSLPKAQA